MTAGYSGTPLPKKLGIKEKSIVGIFNGPKGFSLPNTKKGAKSYDVIVAFFKSQDDLEHDLPDLIKKLCVDGGLWLAWPKKSSGVKTDLSDGTVRDIGLGTGLVDNKVCAIDEVWSGLRFVRRLKDR